MTALNQQNASTGQVNQTIPRVQFADVDLKNSLEGELQPHFGGNEEEETEQVADYYSDDY